MGSRLGQANTLAAQSRLALAQGRDKKAYTLLEQAVALHAEIGSRYGVATDYFNFGLVLRNLGRQEEARPYFQKAATIYANIGLENRAQRARQLAEEGD